MDIPMRSLADAACELPWLAPSAASLIALTRRPSGNLWSSLRDDPDSAPLLLQYARFLDISGNLDQAEKIYRDLLHRNDLDSTQRSIALNNLAFSLAVAKKVPRGSTK